MNLVERRSSGAPRRLSRCALVLLCFGLTAPFDAAGQSSPADLAELSLAELLEVEMVPRARGQEGEIAPRLGWRFAYQYTNVKFEGYRVGTKRVSNASILAAGAPPPPGQYLVLPTKIQQQAHTFGLNYDVFERTGVSVVVPYILQSTDHISIVPGYAFFAIDSEGIGDVALNVTQRLWRGEQHRVFASAGLSFPTGSIDEKGDTPRPGAREQLPYTMQLGSGTWDVLLGATYLASFAAPAPVEWLGGLDTGLEAAGKIRTGENSRGYRLGNRLILSTWLGARPFDWLRPSLRMSAQIWGHIHGRDESLLIPAPTPFFPAPVTDPSLFGGEKLLLTGRVEIGWPRRLMDGALRRWFGGQTLNLEFGAPVYQHLNGPQPEEDWRLNVGLGWRI